MYMLLYQDARMHCHSLPLPSPPPARPVAVLQNSGFRLQLCKIARPIGLPQKADFVSHMHFFLATVRFKQAIAATK